MKGLSLKSAKEKEVVNKDDEGRAFGLAPPAGAISRQSG